MTRRHNDDVETNGGAGKAMIQQKSARRPGVLQPMTRWPSLVGEQQATRKEDAVHVSRYPRSREMVPQRKLARKYTEINQAKSKRSVAKASIRPVNESCKVVIFNGRRVAIQQKSNDYDYPGRRNGLCAGTDPAQQELTFIRVLRKRFWWVITRIQRRSNCYRTFQKQAKHAKRILARVNIRRIFFFWY